jgi:glucosylceramidase
MQNAKWVVAFELAVCAVLVSCLSNNLGVNVVPDRNQPHYRLSATTEILVTSEAGEKLAEQPNIPFRDGTPTGTRVVVRPEVVKQTITGIGTSFTESSAFVLAHLDEQRRAVVMEKIYGESGANFSMARTPIGATDFSVEGKYSYADVPRDDTLAHFSIAVDKDGFSAARYPGIKDESFDLLPMIKEALAIKAAQNGGSLRIVASAWTAPTWMKDVDDWYVSPSADNDYQGTGGALKPQYSQTYADYLLRYLEAYKAEGVDVWGLTPVNEPEGNGGHWESMHFTPESQNAFIKDQLGPTLRGSDHRDVQVLIYDHNRHNLEAWTDVILGDPQTAEYVGGTAIHWYASTFKVYEDILDRVRDKFPGFSLIHTEGTIDALGTPAPEGVLDPVGFEESGWFDNDEFWWNPNATDWAYTATWAPQPEDHPRYIPVHRYARNIIVSLNHGVEGWIDWNIVLDQQGGPNHVGNFCGAPIMVDVRSGYVYYTPIYYVLAQFSRTIRPGDQAVEVTTHLDGLEEDALHASATRNDDGLLSVQLLNTTKHPVECALQIGAQFAPITIPANAVQTVRVPALASSPSTP